MKYVKKVLSGIVKYSNQILTILLICSILISAGMICEEIAIAGRSISSGLGTVGWELYKIGEAFEPEEDFLRENPAAMYMNVELEQFRVMFENGELEGTYYQSPSTGEIFFSREKLNEWLLEKIEE